MRKRVDGNGQVRGKSRTNECVQLYDPRILYRCFSPRIDSSEKAKTTGTMDWVPVTTLTANYTIYPGFYTPTSVM